MAQLNLKGRIIEFLGQGGKTWPEIKVAFSDVEEPLLSEGLASLVFQEAAMYANKRYSLRTEGARQ